MTFGRDVHGERYAEGAAEFYLNFKANLVALAWEKHPRSFKGRKRHSDKTSKDSGEGESMSVCPCPGSAAAISETGYVTGLPLPHTE